MAFQCLTLGDSLYQNGLGELEVQLATDSGLEILGSGLSIVDEQRAPIRYSYTPWVRIGSAGISTATMTALGNGTLEGWYEQVGDIVHFGIYFLLGSTTSYSGRSGTLYFGLPFEADTTERCVDAQYVSYDSSATTSYSGSARSSVSPTTVDPTWQVILITNGTAADTSITGSSPFSSSTNDFYRIVGKFRRA